MTIEEYIYESMVLSQKYGIFKLYSDQHMPPVRLEKGDTPRLANLLNTVAHRLLVRRHSVYIQGLKEDPLEVYGSRFDRPERRPWGILDISHGDVRPFKASGVTLSPVKSMLPQVKERYLESVKRIISYNETSSVRSYQIHLGGGIVRRENYFEELPDDTSINSLVGGPSDQTIVSLLQASLGTGSSSTGVEGLVSSGTSTGLGVNVTSTRVDDVWIAMPGLQTPTGEG